MREFIKIIEAAQRVKDKTQTTKPQNPASEKNKRNGILYQFQIKIKKHYISLLNKELLKRKDDVR